MDKLFKLEFAKGEVFKAKLLEKAAPKTCRVFLESLPFSCSGLTEAFCGYLLYLEKSFELHEPENPYVFGVQPGDILLNINTNKAIFEDKIVAPKMVIPFYKSVILWNWSGLTPSNLFAKIIDGDLEALLLAGRRILKEGKEDIKCSLL